MGLFQMYQGAHYAVFMYRAMNREDVEEGKTETEEEKTVVEIDIISSLVMTDVFCKERIHSIAIATTQCCNLTWSLCGHESQAKKPARSRAGFATKGYHAHHSM